MCSDWEIRVFERVLHSDFIVYLNHSLLQEDKEYVGNKPLAILIPPTFYPSQHTLLSGVVPSQARSDVSFYLTDRLSPDYNAFYVLKWVRRAIR